MCSRQLEDLLYSHSSRYRMQTNFTYNQTRKVSSPGLHGDSAPSDTWWRPEEALRKNKRRRGRPGRRIPEAMHSMTRRRASPGPSGRLQVAMAFSQMSSRGCRQRAERRHSMAATVPSQRPFLLGTYPSFERLPLGESVAHVSENPQDDHARLQVRHSGLGDRTQVSIINHQRKCPDIYSAALS